MGDTIREGLVAARTKESVRLRKEISWYQETVSHYRSQLVQAEARAEAAEVQVAALKGVVRDLQAMVIAPLE